MGGARTSIAFRPTRTRSLSGGNATWTWIDKAVFRRDETEQAIIGKAQGEASSRVSSVGGAISGRVKHGEPRELKDRNTKRIRAGTTVWKGTSIAVKGWDHSRGAGNRSETADSTQWGRTTRRGHIIERGNTQKPRMKIV